MKTNASSLSKEQLAKLPHVVIVGAGFGGLQAARALGNAPVRVTVIDRTNHHLFQPLLYQVATAGLSPADISVPIRHVLRKYKNISVIMDEVTGIDVEGRHVLMDDLSLSYDYLIVATGAHENYFGHAKEWRPLAPGLKSIDDARGIRRKILQAFETAELETDPERIQELLTFIVVGGGPTGVEMAGAIAEVAHKTLASEFRHIDTSMARIILVEALPRILGTFPESLGRKVVKELTHLGVDVRLNTALEAIDEHGVIAAGQRIPAHTVIWTAGVQASPAGTWLQGEVDRAGRVKVQEDLTLPGHPEIYVIGDTASATQDGKPLPGVAPVAMQEGRYVGKSIKERVQSTKQPAPFRYKNKGYMATVGRAYGIVDLGFLHITGFLGWIMWLGVHVVYLIGFSNRIIVMLQWAWAYLTFQRRARIITYVADSLPLVKPEEAPRQPVQSR